MEPVATPRPEPTAFSLPFPILFLLPWLLGDILLFLGL